MRYPLCALFLLLAITCHAEEAKPKYVGWIMVMWPTYDITQKYTVIGAEKGYDKCVEKIPVMALALKFPKGAKVDCIDKQYQLTGSEK